MDDSTITQMPRMLTNEESHARITQTLKRLRVRAEQENDFEVLRVVALAELHHQVKYLERINEEVK